MPECDEAMILSGGSCNRIWHGKSTILKLFSLYITYPEGLIMGIYFASVDQATCLKFLSFNFLYAT